MIKEWSVQRKLQLFKDLKKNLKTGVSLENFIKEVNKYDNDCYNKKEVIEMFDEIKSYIERGYIDSVSINKVINSYELILKYPNITEIKLECYIKVLNSSYRTQLNYAELSLVQALKDLYPAFDKSGIIYPVFYKYFFSEFGRNKRKDIDWAANWNISPKKQIELIKNSIEECENKLCHDL